MWKSGASEFAAPKIRRIKSYLKEGGEIWIGTEDNDVRNAAAIQHGGVEQLRTRKDGCALPGKPTGEGDTDAISRLNLDNQGIPIAEWNPE